MSPAERGHTAAAAAPDQLPDTPAPLALAPAATTGQPTGLDPNRVLALQRSVGNAAVSAFLNSGEGGGGALRRMPLAPPAADFEIAAGLASTVRTLRDAAGAAPVGGADGAGPVTMPEPAAPGGASAPGPVPMPSPAGGGDGAGPVTMPEPAASGAASAPGAAPMPSPAGNGSGAGPAAMPDPAVPGGASTPGPVPMPEPAGSGDGAGPVTMPEPAVPGGASTPGPAAMPEPGGEKAAVGAAGPVAMPSPSVPTGGGNGAGPMPTPSTATGGSPPVSSPRGEGAAAAGGAVPLSAPAGGMNGAGPRPTPDAVSGASPIAKSAPDAVSGAGPVAAPAPDAISGASPIAKSAPDAVSGAGPVAVPAPDAISGAGPIAKSAPDAVSGAGPLAAHAPDAVSGAGPVAAPAPDAISGASPIAKPDAVSGASPAAGPAPDAISGAGPIAKPAPDAVSGAAPVVAPKPDAVSGAGPIAKAAPDAGAGAPVHHARHGGGGGGARHAHKPAAEPADAGGAPELDRWKASVDGSTRAIKSPQLDEVANSADSLAGQAKQTEDARKAQQPDFAKEARGQMPPAPQPPQPAEQLDVAGAEEALAMVDLAGKVKLSDQIFPPMAAMPAALITPRPPQPAQPLTPDTAPNATTAPGPGGQVKPDPNAHGVVDKINAVGPVQAGMGPAQGAVISDPGAASLDPLPPAQAEVIGDAAVRVLAQAPAYAQQVVDGAAGTVSPGNAVASFTTIANRWLPTEQQGFTTELEGVAASAGIAGDQLKAKLAAQQAEAAKLHEQADQQLETKAGAATGAVKQRGQDEQAQISGASQAVKDEVQRKQEAAKGASDPSVINARRDQYLEKVQGSVATGYARLRAAKERRIADLQKIAGEQKALYTRDAQMEARRAAEHAGGDQTQGKIAARPVLDWGDKQSLVVDGHVARLTRLATEETERHETAIREAADQARTRIRDWAAEKQGRQRGWWERLMDMVHDYMNQAIATNAAWERQRNAETRNKVAADLTMLADLRDNMRKGNRDAVLGEMARMGAEQRAVVATFLRSGGKDAIGAVAAGLAGRIIAHRIPELGERLEQAALSELKWEQLNLIGMAQTPGFDAGNQAREVGGAIRRVGTQESRLFAALTGRTKIQLEAMRQCYASIYDGDNMDDDIDSDVSGSEQDRADALRTGDPIAGAVATLRDAMDGAGTDEELINRTLRGKTPAERDAIIAAYEKTYHVTLKKDLGSEMRNYELGQAEALLEGDDTKADAMALKDAMDGAGTSESGIDAVYARIRDEVEADAAAKGMKTAEVEAEIKRRNLQVKKVYGNEFDEGNENALIEDFHSELSGGELKYALAEQEYDQTAIDAATLQKEHEGMWTSDSVVNDTLRNQYQRAEKEILRDLAVDFQARSKNMTPSQRKAAWKQEKAKAQAMAIERSSRYMKDLKANYNKDAFTFGLDEDGPTAFDSLIENEVSGYDKDEAKERIASGGYLDEANELYYAIYGPGTKEARIKEVLKGKSKAEIETIKRKYEAMTGEQLADDLEGDLSGRDEAETLAVLETGDESLEEKLALLKKRTEWEVGDGTGVAGGLALGEEERILLATNKEAMAAYTTYSDLRAKLGEDHPDTIAARERLERWLGYGDKDIEAHREAMDSITDTIVMVGAAAVGVAATVLTGGAAAAPIIAAYFGTSVAVVSAVAGAIAATAASIALKRTMKGGAYAGEDVAIDFAQGTAEAIIAAATVGTGTAALKVLRGAPAIGVIARAAEGGLFKKIIYKGAEISIDGLVSGLPSGMMAAILDENTWKNPNPFAVIVKAGGEGAEAAIKMGAITTAAHATGSKAIKSFRGGGGGKAPISDGVPQPIRDEPSTQPHTSDGVPEPIHDEPKTHPDAAPKEQVHDYDATGRHDDSGAPVIEDVVEDHATDRHEAPDTTPQEEPVDIELEGDSDGVPDHVDDGPATEPHTDHDAPVIEDVVEDHPTDRHEAADTSPHEEPVDLELAGDSDGVPDAIDDHGSSETTNPHDADRTNRITDPAAPEPITDEPGGPHIAPSDGVPQVPGSEDTHPVRDTEPQERTQRTPDPDAPEHITDEPNSKHEVPDEVLPITDLPDGSVISGEKKPFSSRQARKVYKQTIADSPHREAMIMENVKTGERIVVQGSETVVEWDAKARAEFLAGKLEGGVWRVVRHYHPVIKGTNASHPVHRYASGGDMAGAEADAQLTGEAQRETLDFETEKGPVELDYGYDPKRGKKPFWTEVIGPDGQKTIKDFATVESYTEWYEGQTNNYDPPPLPTGGGASPPIPPDAKGRKAPGTGERPPAEHEGAPPKIEPWPEGTIISGPKERPFTLADAEHNYEGLIAADDLREAMVLINDLTGEHVVLQGHEAITEATVERWAEFDKRRGGGGGRWRGVRHYHGQSIGPDGKKFTKPEHELPSGAGGDMEAAQRDAEKTFKPTREILDVVKDGKRIEIEYGYDQTNPEKKPFWVQLPGEPKVTFRDLNAYHFWFELQTGVKHPKTLAPNGKK